MAIFELSDPDLVSLDTSKPKFYEFSNQWGILKINRKWQMNRKLGQIDDRKRIQIISPIILLTIYAVKNMPQIILTVASSFPTFFLKL